LVFPAQVQQHPRLGNPSTRRLCANCTYQTTEPSRFLR
jgi:hypothetical protein